MSVEKPEEIAAKPEGLTHDIEEGVAVLPLAEAAHLTVTLERVGKGKNAKYIAKLVLIDKGEEVSKAEIPAHKLYIYTRPKYDMFRRALKERLPTVNGRRLKLADVFNYLDTRVIPELVEIYEEMRRKRLEEKRRKLQELMEQYKEELEPIIRDPVTHILEVVDFYHVGDNAAKRQAVPVIASRFLPKDWRLHMVVQGPSSAGKNNLVKAFLKVTPKKWWIIVTRLTAKALDYLPDKIDRQILYIQEYEGARGASYSVRITLSEGYLSVLYVRRNEKTGELETAEKRLEGTPVFITTTTAVEIDEDMENRTFYATIDISEEQTKRILEHEAKLASDPAYIRREAEIKRKAKFIRLFFKTLRPVRVIIPPEYTEELMKELPTDSVRVRRDYKKLLAAIMAMAALHQHTREKTEIEGKEFIIAAREDVEYVKRWFLQNIKRQVREIKAVDERVIRCIIDEGIVEITATNTKLKKCSNLSYRHLKRVLDHLADIGLLTKNEKVRPHKYELNQDAAEEYGFLRKDEESDDGKPRRQPKLSEYVSKSHSTDMSDPWQKNLGTDSKYERSDTLTHAKRERKNEPLTPRDVYNKLYETHGNTCVPLNIVLEELQDWYGLDQEDADRLLKQLAEGELVEFKQVEGEEVPSLCILE